MYWNFFLDFGPLNLGQLYRFCALLNGKLQNPSLKRKVIYYYSGTHAHRRCNAAFLVSAWSLLYLSRSADDAHKPFASVYPPFPPFHDASPCACTYNLTVIDCLKGIEKARMYGFFNFGTFDCDEYEYFEQVENGDLNWHIHDKILCFAGPHNTKEVSREGYRTLTPDDYIPYFKKHNVKLVIRLNKKYYDEGKFINAGINHLEQYYLDGSVPPIRILKKVLAAIDSVVSSSGDGGGAVAVHCKAGLGRAGTCTACWIMKTYRMTAAETIGWMRICRPGSIIGPQQHFLAEMQQQLWHEGDTARSRPLPALSQAGGDDDDDDDGKGDKAATAMGGKQQQRSLRAGADAGGVVAGVAAMGLDEAAVGRPGQSEELRTRRAQKDSSSPASASGGGGSSGYFSRK